MALLVALTLGLICITLWGGLKATPASAQEEETTGPMGESAWAWGDNVHGQLGDGTTTQRNTPVQVSGLSGVKQIAGGNFHSLALKSDGTVWAWGSNGNGQLGDGTTTQRNTPVRVSGLSGVKQIAGGNSHSLALKSDGTVWAWGNNSNGQLGDGTITNSSTPVQVSGLSDVMDITGGGFHSLALRADTTAPSVALTDPQEGATVGGKVRLAATASDNLGVDRVDFLVNGRLIDTDITAPYSRYWDSGAIEEDTVRITARAYDASGNYTSSSRTVNVDNVAPGAPSISSPASGSYDTDGNITLSGRTEANTTVRLYEGSTLVATVSASSSETWSRTLNGVADGSHRYTAKATDAAGNTSAASSAVSVIVDSTAPSVSAIFPLSNARGVSPTANITATFSEAIDQSTLDNTTFRLTLNGSSTPVGAVVSYDAATRKATLNPNATTLKRGKTYRAVVSSGITDQAGNPLTERAWTFTIKK